MNIRRPLIVALTLGAAMACLSLAAAAVLPATVPLRFNAHGVPTAYGSAYMPLALMPLVALALSALCVALARSEPRRDNLAASSFAYSTRWIGATGLIAAIHVWIVYTLVTTVRGAAPLDPTRLVFALVGVMIAIVGSQLAKVRSNFMIGIRTPWTLADDRVWERTHRLARWPVMLAGAAILIAALAAPAAMLLTVTSTVIITVSIGLVVLSYMLWRGRNGHRAGA